MKSAAIVIATLIMTAGGSLAALATAVPALAREQSAAQTVVFAVENMTCELCPLTVKTAIERVPGVTSVMIAFDAKTATVTFDPATATIEAIAAAPTNVGYPTHVAGN
jgi:mercuric ion binding protein